MYRILSAFIAVFLLTVPAVPASAQMDDTGASVEQVEAARQRVREEGLRIIREAMNLTDEQAQEFWPLYDRYRAEILEVEDTYVELLRDFLQKYYGYSVTNKDAKEYVDLYFDIQSDRLKIRKKYLRRFRRILSDIEVMRLYQIENKLRAEVDVALAGTVPLADPS